MGTGDGDRSKLLNFLNSDGTEIGNEIGKWGKWGEMGDSDLF